MSVINFVTHNFFRDSIQLMRLSEEAKKLPGIQEAVVSMGTETNKLLLEQLGMLMAEGRSAAEGDMVIALRFAPGSDANAALESVQRLLVSPSRSEEPGEGAETYHSVDSAIRMLPGANLAIVSLPGREAFKPSMELLRRGINVHLFSDHVSSSEELRLKKYADSNGLLVLGPGAGTSLIGGVGLGFANVVRRGPVGVVASAGTGLQEVSVLLDRIGLGISHGLGVGGMDVSKEIGGIMTRDCLALLERDASTKAVMIVAKTPTAAVTRSIVSFARRNLSKPVVACFLGSASGKRSPGLKCAPTLHSAVWEMATLSGKLPAKTFKEKVAITMPRLAKMAETASTGLAPGQKFARGLYSGGTLAHEALLVYRELAVEAYSNTPLSRRFALADPAKSRGNSIIDLGDEYFTAGRPHPMIDPTLRKLRILQESGDPSVAVIMLDVVLGYGSSSDPGGSLVSAIEDGRRSAKEAGRRLVFMAHVCGTEADPQSLSGQSGKLSKVGVYLFATNAQMAVASALIVGGPRARSELRRRWRGLLGEP